MPADRKRGLRLSVAGLAAGGLLMLAPAGLAGGRAGGEASSLETVRGVTISCQTSGWEWGTEGFGVELEELSGLGVNWVAIHPYARIHGDGRVTWRAIDPEAPPEWIALPIQEAKRRGMGILIKPHLAYWGSPFRWRGEIAFEGAERERFFADYGRWIVTLARASAGADAFAIGTELDLLAGAEGSWRALISAVRGVTDARLTYASNWTDFERVPFWDALDAVGVQAYFPLAEGEAPTGEELVAGWESVLARLRAVHEATGKPVVLTELGYDRTLSAAAAPWKTGRAPAAEAARAEALQLSCYEAALRALERERSWLRGAFLWKWFVGEPGWNDKSFLVDTPSVREVVSRFWGS